MARKSTDLRRHRRQTERNLLLGVMGLLVIVGGALVGLIYDWGAALSALLCLIPGALAILGLWFLMGGLERWTRDRD